jgi:hypothetical protein
MRWGADVLASTSQSEVRLEKLRGEDNKQQIPFGNDNKKDGFS